MSGATLPSAGTAARTWEAQARSILRTFLARSKSTFGDDPDWQRLKVVQEELAVSAQQRTRDGRR